MHSTNALTRSLTDSDTDVNIREAKDDARGSARSQLSTADEKPHAERLSKPKKVLIGWSLLAFGVFCLAAWAVIFLVLHFLL